jgi:hypothetical protein
VAPDADLRFGTTSMEEIIIEAGSITEFFEEPLGVRKVEDERRCPVVFQLRARVA